MGGKKSEIFCATKMFETPHWRSTHAIRSTIGNNRRRRREGKVVEGTSNTNRLPELGAFVIEVIEVKLMYDVNGDALPADGTGAGDTGDEAHHPNETIVNTVTAHNSGIPCVNTDMKFLRTFPSEDKSGLWGEAM